MNFFAFARLLAPAFLALSAVPVHAESHCRYLRIGEMPVRYVGESLLPAIDATINGTPAVMAINTGSFANFLTPTAAAQRRLPVGRVSGYSVQGAGGTTDLYTARITGMTAGPARTGESEIGVSQDSTEWYDGTMGAPFAFQADLEFNLAEKKLTFYKPYKDTCQDTFLGYWSPNVVAIPTERSRHGAQSPHFTIELNGVKLDAVIASGTTRTMVEIDAARRAGIDMDGPGVQRVSNVRAVGTRAVERWRAQFDSLKIGSEKIDHPVLDVIDSHGPNNFEIQLGVDFLRSHRVLFAESQKKLYFSYVGGEAIGSPEGELGLLQREAEAGNPDAEYNLARKHLRAGSQYQQQGMAWLDKAAAHGQPQAQVTSGHILLKNGRYAQAAELLRQGSQRLPLDHYAALDLYIAQVGAAAAGTGLQQLEESFPLDVSKGRLATIFGDRSEPAWPWPIADFYLGRIDAATLLDKAARQERNGKHRICDAYRYMAWLYTAQHNTNELNALRMKSADSLRCLDSGTAGASSQEGSI